MDSHHFSDDKDDEDDDSVSMQNEGGDKEDKKDGTGDNKSQNLPQLRKKTGTFKEDAKFGFQDSEP